MRLPDAAELGMGPRVAVPVRDDGVLGFVWLIDEGVGPAELAAAEETAAAAAPLLAQLRARRAQRPRARRRAARHRSRARASGPPRRCASAALRGPVRVLVGDAAVLGTGGSCAAARPRCSSVATTDLDAPIAGALGMSGAARALEDAHAARPEAETAAALAPVIGARRRPLGPARLLPAARPARRRADPGRAAAAARPRRRRAARRHAGGLPRPRRRRTRDGRGALHPPHDPLPPAAPDRGDHGRRACATATTACCCTWGCGSAACGDYARSVREPGLLSVVAPMHDEEDTVDAFHARTRRARWRGSSSSWCWSTTARATRRASGCARWRPPTSASR